MFNEEQNLSKTAILILVLGLVAFILQVSYDVSRIKSALNEKNSPGQVPRIDDFTYVSRPWLGIFYF